VENFTSRRYKRKLLAAYRYGVEEVILPKQNQKDLEKVPEEVKRKLKFHFVEHLDEAVSIVLVPESYLKR